MLNKVFEIIGNSVEDVGQLSNLDNYHNSNVRAVYSVPVTSNLRESIREVVRFNKSDKNAIEFVPKMVVTVMLMQCILIDVFICLSCRG